MSSACAAAAGIARPFDEVVIKLDSVQFPQLAGTAIDKIHLYRWSESSRTFTPIPFQIDEVKRVVDLKEDLSACLASCPVNNPEIPDSLCESNYAFNYATGEPPGPLDDDDGTYIVDANDELVFRGRDAGAECAPSDEWVLPLHTWDLRFDIVVKDQRLDGNSLSELGSACVHLFVFDDPRAPAWLEDEYYVRWASFAGEQGEQCRWGDPVHERGRRACGVASPGPEAEEAGMSIETRWIGNWTLDQVKLNGSSTDVMDRFKTRMNIANIHNEEGYDLYCCARFMGEKHYNESTKRDPIRALRFAKGALSGFGTTRNDWHYGTHFVFRVRLRVHPGPGDMRNYFDLDSDATPANVYTKQQAEIVDVAQGDDAVNERLSELDTYSQGEFNWVKYQTRAGNFLAIMHETYPFSFADETQHFYSDRRSFVDAPEADAGRLGSSGHFWPGGARNMQDDSCNTSDPDAPALWKEALWYVVPYDDAIGVSSYVDALRFPLTVSVEDKWRVGWSPPPPPCVPSLELAPDLDSESVDIWAHLSPPDAGCVNDLVSVYRSVGVGRYRKLASLVPGTKFRDASVQHGVTYRYIAFGHDPLGNSSSGSLTYQFLAQDTQPPPPPAVTDVEPVVGGVRIAWSPGGGLDVVGVNILIANSPGGPYMRVNSAPILEPTREYLISPLEPLQAYYLVLQAVDDVGLSSVLSAEVSVVPYE